MVSSPQGSAPPNQIAQFRSDGFTAATGLRVPFFSDGFSRAYGLPETRLVNMISEATPLREERPYVPLIGLREIRFSRPGLSPAYAYGSGPIRALALAPPAFGDGFYIVSGNTVFNQAGTNLGTIPGTDLVRFASSRSQVVAVSSGVAYLYAGTGAFTAIVNPVLPPVSDVAYLAGRFVYQVAASDRFYYSEINDAGNESGLSFATAESSADNTVGIAVLNEELVFFGANSVEFWSVSSDPAAPYQPVEGRGFQRGCAAQGSIAFADNALFWVGDNRVVYRSENVPTRISSNSIDDELRQCPNIAAVTAFAATFEGHELYVLNIPGVGSYAYDCSRVGTAMGAYADSYSRGEWSEWQSFGRGQFRGQVAISINDVTWVGDDTTNQVGQFQSGLYSDYGGPLARVASAFIKIEEGRPRCLNLVLQCGVGVGNAVDPGSKPVAEMRFSDDLGRTFSEWRSTPLGLMGDYVNRAFWQRLGLMRAPGRLVEIRVSDPVDAVFSHLELNASRPAG
ncbi:MAG: packaged DNA stabilization protein gp10 [Pseudomonadota bacterium]|nr:packaged DNA stabilization protein gp10 [Pseudomonadota bacterium]